MLFPLPWTPSLLSSTCWVSHLPPTPASRVPFSKSCYLPQPRCRHPFEHSSAMTLAPCVWKLFICGCLPLTRRGALSIHQSLICTQRLAYRWCWQMVKVVEAYLGQNDLYQPETRWFIHDILCCFVRRVEGTTELTKLPSQTRPAVWEGVGVSIDFGPGSWDRLLFFSF